MACEVSFETFSYILGTLTSHAYKINLEISVQKLILRQLQDNCRQAMVIKYKFNKNYWAAY